MAGSPSRHRPRRRVAQVHLEALELETVQIGVITTGLEEGHDLYPPGEQGPVTAEPMKAAGPGDENSIL